MSRNRRKNREDDDNGFEEWVNTLFTNLQYLTSLFQGGYMEAKKAKLREQYKETAVNQVEKLSDIFSGVSIFVNGLTHPTSNELKLLMAAHGGTFHLYQHSTTTHIIASNLPNVKVRVISA